MTADVVAFDPKNGQKVENIPHMLRYWADELEAGRQAQPDSAVLILKSPSETDLCIFGENMSEYELVGLLHMMAMRVGK